MNMYLSLLYRFTSKRNYITSYPSHNVKSYKFYIGIRERISDTKYNLHAKSMITFNIKSQLKPVFIQQ